jgi:allantoate deiminase
MSPAMRRANALVGGWMRRAGLAVRIDATGNLIGRAGGRARNAGTLLLGSHLDTVRDAGRFDGALGVLLPIAALEVLRARGIRLPFAVEVLGFSEEEGVRFSSGYLGSKGYVGRLGSPELRLRDGAGITVGEVLAGRAGGSFRPPAPAHARGELLGYLEAHIEQGPILETRRLAAGVVSAIAGQTRARIVFRGVAGHAGTTPMRLRRDALAGAAEFILAAEAAARHHPGLVATVGCIAAHPGAPNVIAGRAELSLDVRHASDARRRAAVAGLRTMGRRIATRRGLAFAMETTQDNGAVACSATLTRALARSVRSCQGRCVTLTSGAGHDAVIVSSLAPVAMLFVRCRGGVSHHPDEFVSATDLRVALEILVDFLTRMASRDDQ